MSQLHSHRVSQTQLSKTLSYILRHGAHHKNIAISVDGYVKINDILNQPEFIKNKVELETLFEIVNNDSKKRYEIKQENYNGKPFWFIRASQGHSLKNLSEEKMFSKITDHSKISLCVHGTFRKNWESIKINGLNRMSRKHIHFATGYNTGEKSVISGMRNSCDTFIELDLAKAMNDGMIFYLSSNDVILTEGFDDIVPVAYFKQVFTKDNNVLSIL